MLISFILNAGCNMSDYYHDHSEEFINNTFECDMSTQYHFFEKHLANAGTILDIGFGSGRDSLYFKNKGYDVYSIDPEIEFVEHGKKLGLSNISCLKVEEMSYLDMFDGIWACASLLHIPSKDLNNVFKKCALALKPNGVMYASFKYGRFEGLRNGRYYLDLDENSVTNYLKDTGLKIIDILITKDVRPDREENWLNIILKRI